MQSNQGAPVITLKLVPKILSPLVKFWVPNAFVISFKLETDENLLISKARDALNKYSHKLVIANMLQTRRTKVTFVTQKSDFEITLNDDEERMGVEIEKKIIDGVLKLHNEFQNKNYKNL